MNNLITYLKNSQEYLRLNELKNYFLGNTKLMEKLDKYLDLQKKLMQAKHKEDMDEYAKIKAEYEFLEKEIIDLPFVEEYFALLAEYQKILAYISQSIDDDLSGILAIK